MTPRGRSRTSGATSRPVMATPGAIAKSLGIPRSTLELAMRRRELTYIVPNRRVRLLRLADVERWLASCTVPADPIAGAS